MRCLLVVFLLLNSIFLVFGQVAPQTEKIGPITQASQQNQETWKKQQESLINDSERKLRDLNGEVDIFSPMPNGGYLPEPKLSKEQKLLITPTKDELSQSNEFLKLPKTGIFKILPSPDCGNKLVIDVRDERCLNKNHIDLSYYSFRKRLYAGLAWSDLNYEDKKLLVGFERRTIGFIREIGDDLFVQLHKDSGEIKALIEFKLPKESAQIKAKKEEIKTGIEIARSKFFERVEAKLNQTYLLRSYSYRTEADAYNDRRIDIIVAFKIVGMDADKNLTIIWKELYKGDTYKI